MRRLAWVQFFSWFALARLQHGRQLGGGVICRQQLLSHRWGGRHSTHGARARSALEPSREPGGERTRARLVRLVPQPRAAPSLHGRCRFRLGLDSVAPLYAAFGQPADGKDGRLHGHLQFLHRHSADAGGQRSRLVGTCLLRRSPGIRAGARGHQHGARRALHAAGHGTVPGRSGFAIRHGHRKGPGKGLPAAHRARFR